MMLYCIKYLVILYNFVFWLLGVALLATTIFLYVDSQTYVGFGETSEQYMTLFLLLMALGAVMTLVGFLGCCGAIRESGCVLATYFLLCVTMCVACGAAVWWSTENRELMRNKLQNEVLTVVREKYGKGSPGTTESIVDSIQRDFACCGLKGYQDWANSFYNQPGSNGSLVDYGLGGTQTPPRNPNERFKLPASCCATGVSSYDCERYRTELNHSPSQPVPGIHGDGCWFKFNRYIEEQWKWWIIVAVLVIGVQFFALILSCCLCCAISRSDDKIANNMKSQHNSFSSLPTT